MAKSDTIYVCRECGYESAKWAGKCPSCESWNTLDEEIRKSDKVTAFSENKHYVAPKKLGELVAGEEIRYKTGIKEFDRVLGGGIVKGSLVLVSGDPGIGKSTILLQMCKHLPDNLSVIYITGEESARQIKLRADRLSVESDNLYIMAENDIEIVSKSIYTQKPDIVIIDSIQTMYTDQVSSSPGSVTQVRECTNALLRVSKSLGIPIFIVGHVNKEGSIAGPKVLEHIVDCVLYFEGEKQLSYRILRAVKNRYGSTNEIGVFEMTDTGLAEISNPSMMFLSGRPKNVSGTCVACVLEGTRPIFAEIQALITPTPFPAPRRTSVGMDYNRINLLLAVLEKRLGYRFMNMDVYLNVVGGMKLYEPSGDLAAVLAMASGLKDFVIPDSIFAVGEIGLTGEVRAVTGIDMRIKEAERLGFEKCLVPYQSKISGKYSNIEIIKVKSLYEAISKLK